MGVFSKIKKSGKRKLPPFVQYTFFPLLESFLLGAGFSLCDPLLRSLPTFTVCAVRYGVAAIAVVCYTIFLGKQGKIFEKENLLGGILAGLLGALASGACYTGQSFSGAGKSGFIISMYVFFVPILDLLRGNLVKTRIWICEGFIFAGLWLLCMNNETGLSGGDALLLLSSLLYALQVLVFDRYMKTCDPAPFTTVLYVSQALFAGLVSVFLESPDPALFRENLGALILVGILCSAVPYTVGAYAQQGGDVNRLSILWSTESVFSVLCATAFLHEKMSLKELLGCLIVFAAVVLSYVEPKKKKKGECHENSGQLL